jgi:hypothetical protein
MVVGGVPSIVVLVRQSWMPNWYLAGCVAAAHYPDAKANVRWTSNNSLTIIHSDPPYYWDPNSAPFHNNPCKEVRVTLQPTAA